MGICQAPLTGIIALTASEHRGPVIRFPVVQIRKLRPRGKDSPKVS